MKLLLKIIKDHSMYEDNDLFFYNCYYKWIPDLKNLKKIENKKNEYTASSARILMEKSPEVVDSLDISVLINFLTLMKKKYKRIS